MLSPAFRSKQRRSIFKKFLRLFGLPDFSQIYLFSDGLWKKKEFLIFKKMGRKYLTMFIRYISIVVSSF